MANARYLHYSTTVEDCLDNVFSALERAGCRPKRLPSGEIRAHCPCHDDKVPSLVIGADSCKVLIHDFGGCDTAKILKTIGLSFADLYPDGEDRNRRPKPQEPTPAQDPQGPSVLGSHIYEIRDPNGNLVAIHKRVELGDGSKRFHWLKADGSISKGDIRPAELPLYGVHELANANMCIVVEGEKSRDALASLGIPAVGTVCGAASTPCDDALRPLLDVATVHLWPDADEPGRAHMARIAQRLHALGHKDVRVISWPQAPDGGDAADLIERAESPKVARELILQLLEKQAEPWKPVQGMSYEDLKKIFEGWLYLPDDTSLKFILCAVIANRLPGDPFWAFLVGPSGSSKTELLNSLTALDFVKPLDTLTTSTFLSGKQRKDPQASLLLRVPYGTIFLVRDFTSVLEMHREKRAEIFAQLRKIYDGHLTKMTGEGGESAELSWEGKVGLIAGVTPAIEGYRAFATTLGERFLYHYLPVLDRSAAAQAALRNREHLARMRAELRQAVRKFFEGLHIPEHVVIPDEISEWLVGIADFVSLARTGVERDYSSRDREIAEVPDPEVPTRLAQQLGALACAHAVLCGREYVTPDDLAMIAHTALACIPTRRRLVLKVLAEANAAVETSAVAEIVDLPTPTVRRDLEDLTALRLAERIKLGEGRADLWQATEATLKGWHLLTQFDARVKVQNSVPVLHKSTLSEKSASVCKGEGSQDHSSLCVVGDVSDKVGDFASGTDKATVTRPSDDADEDDIPF